MRLGLTSIVFFLVDFEILVDSEISKQCSCVLTGFGRRTLSTRAERCHSVIVARGKDVVNELQQ